MRELLSVLCILGTAWGARSVPAGEDPAPRVAVQELGVDELVAQVDDSKRLPVWGRRTPAASAAGIELGRRIDAGVALTDDQWRTLLLRSGAVLFRRSWWASKPFEIWMIPPTWLGNVELRLTPRDERLVAAVGGALAPECGTTGVRYPEESNRVLGHLAPGEQRLVFDVELERGAPRDFDPCNGEYVRPDPPHLLWKGELSMEVDVRTSLDEALPPVSGPQLDESVAKALEMRVFDPPERDRKSAFPMRPGQYYAARPSTQLHGSFDGTPFEHVAVALDVVLRSGTEEVRVGNMFGRRGFVSIPLSREELESELEPWTVTVTGRAEWNVAPWDTDRRYSGSVTIPVRELLERGRAEKR